MRTMEAVLRKVARRARSLWRRVAHPPGTAPVILLYHRIADAASDPWNLCVAPDRFRDHLAMLREERCVLPLADLVAQIEQRASPPFATAITFDDGFIDNLDTAAPMLAEAGLPATLFATVGNVASQERFAWDETEGAARPMTEAQLQQAAQVFAIGAHARDHVPLTGIEPHARTAQIAGSRRDLARILGSPPAGFAYPHGDYDAAVRQQVVEAGFAWAMAVHNRAVFPRFDRFALPRLTVGDWSAARLRREIRDAGG